MKPRGSLVVPADIREEFETLAAGTVDILPAQEFVEKLVKSRREGRPLRVKYGADPSAPDIHLGHSVPIRKLRQFQDLGHQVVFIVGDYTARIGDPSGKSATRRQLSADEVNANAQTYLDQIFKILDRDRTEVVFNSSWLEAMDVSATIKLMGRYTVSQMLERDDFHKRFEQETPIYIHEFIYPLLQGYDSIAVKADVEIGGTDQKFNLLVGRELQRGEGQAQQCIMTLPLLVGLDGENKMSKSLDNYIGISEDARTIFGKTMSVPDGAMWDFFVLAAGRAEVEAEELRRAVESGARHPREVKEELARALTALYHGKAAALREAEDFRARFSQRSFPEDTAERLEFAVGEAGTLSKLLVAMGASKSARDAQRLAEQGAVHVFEEPEPGALGSAERTALAKTTLGSGTYKLKVGKTRFVVVTLK